MSGKNSELRREGGGYVKRQTDIQTDPDADRDRHTDRQTGLEVLQGTDKKCLALRVG